MTVRTKMAKKNKASDSSMTINGRRDFIALAAKFRKAGTMQDRRKRREKEKENFLSCYNGAE